MKNDREKWDRRYADDEARVRDPDPLLQENAGLLLGGRALDVACGKGRHALFAARRGSIVDATDISLNALETLKYRADREGLRINCFQADLDEYEFPPGLYDLVTVFYFFAATLLPSIAAALKKGGLLFYATYNHRHTSVKPGFNPDYLVPEGGLRPYFPGLHVILDHPETGADKNISQLIARKPED